MKESSWNRFLQVSDNRLYQARGQLHQAVQLLTAIGISYVEQKPDDSHTSLLWDTKTHMFLSQTFGPNQKFQIGLIPQNLSCHVIHNHDSLLVMNLNGATLNQVASDLQFFLEDHGLPKDGFTMEKHFELPDYPPRWSAPFDTSDHLAFDQLSAAYSNAYQVIRAIVINEDRAGSIMTWPHHFDMAVLLTQGEGKSIGIGMSPGDTSYAGPYFYVNVWPYPPEDQIQDLPLTVGKWHTEGWTGMILPLNQIVDKETAKDQKSMVEIFLNQAKQHGDIITEASQ